MSRASFLFALVSIAAVWSGLGLWLALGISVVTLALLQLDRRSQ